MTRTGSAERARAAAARTVDRVTRSGAYSNVLVARTAVEPNRDHGFYQRLVYSVLRYLPGIDKRLEVAANRPVRAIDPMTRAALRVAIADLCVLGTEPYAVVSEGVETIRELGRPRATGFVNAVLRVVADRPDRIGNDLADSYPEHVIAMLVTDLGESDAKRFLEASNEPAPVGVRRRSGTESPSQPARYLSPGESIEDVGPPDAVDVIDPASYAVARALDARPGDRVVDLAAAPGGKTRVVADAMEGTGVLVACDLHPRRVRDAARRSRAVPIISWVRADAARPPFRDRSFDRVLLDAPCTGLGTMRRRPEIRDRVRPGSAGEYGTLQRGMVERAIDLVRPGGRLVYSVCTVTHAETVAVVDGLGFTPPELPLGRPAGDGRLLTPDRDGTDGMFIAVLDR